MANEFGVPDFPQPTKQPTIPYDPAILRGSINGQGSVSTTFDLSGWTNFALKVDPNGTVTGGTTWTVWTAPDKSSNFVPYIGTTGTTAQTIQIGSTGTQVYGPITFLTPLRFVQFVAAGTQIGTPLLTLFAK